jgi:hypothetical protein
MIARGNDRIPGLGFHLENLFVWGFREQLDSGFDRPIRGNDRGLIVEIIGQLLDLSTTTE